MPVGAEYSKTENKKGRCLNEIGNNKKENDYKNHNANNIYVSNMWFFYFF